MVRRLDEVFPARGDVPVTHCRCGLICGTLRLTPCIVRLTPCIGCLDHDPGVGAADAPRFPDPMAGPARPFPLPPVRLWILRDAGLHQRILDSA